MSFVTGSYDHRHRTGEVVCEERPAQKAGILTGDVITEMGGYKRSFRHGHDDEAAKEPFFNG